LFSLPGGYSLNDKQSLYQNYAPQIKGNFYNKARTFVTNAIQFVTCVLFIL